MIRVLLVDDQKLVRAGWSVLLDHSSDVSIVGQARDGLEAVELAQHLQPDVIVMDVKMPRLDGLDAARRIVSRRHGCKILMVTQSLDETLVRKALQCGARGYVSKTDAFAELLPAILALDADKPYFSKTVREQYPHVVDELLLRVPVGRDNQRGSARATLDGEFERAKAEAQANIEKARSICQQSQMLRAQVRETKAFAVRMRRLPRPSAPVAE